MSCSLMFNIRGLQDSPAIELKREGQSIEYQMGENR